jgi:hypothetical protein
LVTPPAASAQRREASVRPSASRTTLPTARSRATWASSAATSAATSPRAASPPPQVCAQSVLLSPLSSLSVSLPLCLSLFSVSSLSLSSLSLSLSLSVPHFAILSRCKRSRDQLHRNPQRPNVLANVQRRLPCHRCVFLASPVVVVRSPLFCCCCPCRCTGAAFTCTGGVWSGSPKCSPFYSQAFVLSMLRSISGAACPSVPLTPLILL